MGGSAWWLRPRGSSLRGGGGGRKIIEWSAKPREREKKGKDFSLGK